MCPFFDLSIKRYLCKAFCIHKRRKGWWKSSSAKSKILLFQNLYFELNWELLILNLNLTWFSYADPVVFNKKHIKYRNQKNSIDVPVWTSLRFFFKNSKGIIFMILWCEYLKITPGVPRNFNFANLLSYFTFRWWWHFTIKHYIR